MSGSTVTLIINLLLIVVLIACFFIGVVRGAKKQGVRSAYFVGFLIVFLLFSPLISSALMDLQVVNGQSLSGYIQDQITANENVSNMINSNPAMQELVDKLPIIVINLAVVVALTLLALFCSWIAYLITKHVHLNKYKREAKKMKENSKAPNNKIYTVKDGKPVIIDKVEPKSKRYRWWGGLIGAVSGFIIMFAILLPFTGVAKTAMTYINFSASAEVVEEQKTDNFEYQQVSDMLKELLGPDVIDILKGVDDSVFIKVTSVGDVDMALFDTISTVNVNGEKITLRNEVKSVADVTESVLYVQDTIPQTEDGEYDFTNMDWQTLDFDKLEKAVNSLFNSGIIRSVVGDLVDNVFTEDFVDKNINEGDDFYEYKDYVKEVFKEISIAYENDEAKTIDQLRNDCLAILGVAKAVVYSGLANYLSDVETYHNNLTTPQTEFDVVVECLYGKNIKSKEVNHNYLNDITNSIFTSSTFKGLLVAGVNIGCDVFKDEIKEILTEQYKQKHEGALPPESEVAVKFSTVTQDNIDWNSVSTSFYGLVDDSIKIYKYLQDEVNPIMPNETLDEKQKIKSVVTTSGFKNCMTNVGDILNGIINSPLFEIIVDDGSETVKSLVDEFLTELNKIEEINKYVDLNELRKIDWKTECENFADAIKLLNETTVEDEGSVLDAIISEDNNKILAVFGKLSQEQIQNIIHKLNSTPILSKITGQFLNELNISLINIIDSEYNTNVVTKDTNLTPQEESIAKVLFTGLKVKDLDFSDEQIATTFADAQNKQKVKDFIDALKENATLDPNGIFKDAYDKYNEKFSAYLTDE